MADQPPNKSSRSLIPVVAIVATAIVALFALWLWRPRPQELSCIRLPEMQASSTREAAIDLGLKLEKVPLDSTLKTSFRDATAETFQKLDDPELALLLLLRAIECYLKLAQTAEQIELVKATVADLTTMARSQWAAVHDLRGTSTTLSAKEESLLKASPYGPEVLTELEKRGIRP